MRFPGAAKRDSGVETWLQTRPGELGAMARHWFTVMRGSRSDVRELLHDGNATVCVEDAAYAYVGVFTAHVTVGFYQGAELPDPYGMLRGTGKFMRHVRLEPGEDLDTAALTELIRAAYIATKDRLRSG